MRISITHSLWRKLVVTLIVASGFVLIRQATILDSRYAARQALLREDQGEPGPGTRLRFTASAYCRGEVTASGVGVRTGIAAADPEVLPVGSVVQVVFPKWAARHDGVYTVMDTGPVVKGRRLDIYMWNCDEAVRFGLLRAQVFVLRLGWNPRASGPDLLDTLLPWRDSKPKTAAVGPAQRLQAPERGQAPQPADGRR